MHTCGQSGGGKSTGILWKVVLKDPVPLAAIVILLPTFAPGCSLLGGLRNCLCLSGLGASSKLGRSPS